MNDFEIGRLLFLLKEREKLRMTKGLIYTSVNLGSPMEALEAVCVDHPLH